MARPRASRDPGAASTMARPIIAFATGPPRRSFPPAVGSVAVTVMLVAVVGVLVGRQAAVALRIRPAIEHAVARTLRIAVVVVLAIGLEPGEVAGGLAVVGLGGGLVEQAS